MEDTLMTVLKILGAVGLALLAWLVVEGALTVRRLRGTIANLEDRIEPTLANVENITESLQPAAEKIDPLMDRVQLTVDSVNLELMQVDKILGDASQITGTASGAVKKVSDAAGAPSRAVNGAASKLRSVFGKKKNEARIENAMETASLTSPQEPQVEGLTAFDIARDWAAEASGEYAESMGVTAEKPVEESVLQEQPPIEEPQPQPEEPVREPQPQPVAPPARESFTSRIADDGVKGAYPSATALKDLLEEPAMESADSAGEDAEPEAVLEPQEEPETVPEKEAADIQDEAALTAEQKIAEALAQLEEESNKVTTAYEPPKRTVAKSASELVEEALREE